MHQPGFDEILGELANELQVLGYDVNANQLKSSPDAKRALARQLLAHSPVVRNRPVSKKRRWPIGFGPVAVPPGTTITAIASPQILFRGEKLIDTSSTSDENQLFISSIVVGNVQQLPANSNPISVKAFSPGVLDNEMLFDTAQPAQQISFGIQNLGATTATWSACLFGHIAQ